MDEKRSRGVMIIGWGLAILGGFWFLGRVITNILFFGNQKLSLKLLSSYADNFQSLRTSGYPLRDISGHVDLMTRMMVNDNPYLVLITWIAVPVLAFLLFLAGLGVLRSKNEWRKSAMIVSSLLMLTVFVEKIYTASYVFMFVVSGKAVTCGKENVVFEIMKTMKLMPKFLIRDLFFTMLPVCLLVFFFTRENVRAQFK